ncbi:ABC transporter ATP-binding protein [Patescibacteria group bacterium]|nr:ABC transporter ATP-binding protein [Patescibacteria group bacterium]
MPNNPAVKINNLSYHFTLEDKKRFEVLKNISFEVRQGEFFSIVGPSGSGKSTLLRIIAGLIQPSSGSVELLAKKSAMVFQNFAIFPWLTVHENVAFGLRMAGVPAAEQNKIVQEKIKEVGLPGFEKKYPKELSGGMRQRVGIARALAVSPELLLMDEPFSGLDAFTADALRSDLLQIWQKHRMTVVMVTHLVEEALQLSDRIMIVSRRPAEVKQILEVPMARPRNMRSVQFFSLADRIKSQIEL